jgi:predicted cupin superfamily sugar epimerase
MTKNEKLPPRFFVHPETKAVIEHYNLQPLPVEGTLFTSTYRSSANLPSGDPLGTAIIGLYADEPKSLSYFHKLPSDEIWHFYGGDPLKLVLLFPDGSSKEVIMGSDVLAGQVVQYVIPAGVWQAGYMLLGGRYSLFGCTMAPGFTSKGFEAGVLAELLKKYPDRAIDLEGLCVRGHERLMPEGFAT